MTFVSCKCRPLGGVLGKEAFRRPQVLLKYSLNSAVGELPFEDTNSTTTSAPRVWGKQNTRLGNI